jgi:pimeloyl-ACP methyl ester carboxylesterase
MAAIAHGAIQQDTLTLFDQVRHRSIPIAIHTLEGDTRQAVPVVIISHGYNENKAGTYLRFSSLAEYLVIHGYAVVSIQHELPTDPPLPMQGNLRQQRSPNWERGVENISHVLEELQALRPRFALDHVSLIGHSNGGDISILFAERHPDRVGMVISLDNLRMPLPRVSKPRIASLRAMDTRADAGVLPTAEEQRRFGIEVIDMHGFKHVDFNDRASPDQRRRMNTEILRLLQRS